jgi:hypothetical protein
MGKWVRILSSVMCVGVLSLLAREASANEPATAGSLQGGIGVRYGFELEDWDPNPWGAGIGAKLGYTLPNALYFGGTFDYFFGETQRETVSTYEYNLWQAMLEGGYDIAAGESFVIRPKFGAGFAASRWEVCVESSDCSEDTAHDLALAPGIELILDTEHFAVSVDARYDTVFVDGRTISAVMLGAGIGF